LELRLLSTIERTANNNIGKSLFEDSCKGRICKIKKARGAVRLHELLVGWRMYGGG